jgi:hypothetical protein
MEIMNEDLRPQVITDQLEDEVTAPDVIFGVLFVALLGLSLVSALVAFAPTV